jgi:hypothetical protein
MVWIKDNSYKKMVRKERKGRQKNSVLTRIETS